MAETKSGRSGGVRSAPYRRRRVEDNAPYQAAARRDASPHRADIAEMHVFCPDSGKRKISVFHLVNGGNFW